jgi:hypothetical protein
VSAEEGEVTRIHGGTCTDSVRAIDPSTGKFAWERCVRGGDPTGAPTAVPDVGNSEGKLFALSVGGH